MVLANGGRQGMAVLALSIVDNMAGLVRSGAVG